MATPNSIEEFPEQLRAMARILTGWRVVYYGYDDAMKQDVYMVHNPELRHAYIGTRDKALAYYLDITEKGPRSFGNPHFGHADEYGT